LAQLRSYKKDGMAFALFVCQTELNEEQIEAISIAGVKEGIM